MIARWSRDVNNGDNSVPRHITANTILTKKRLHSVTAKCDYQPIIQHVFRFCLIMWYQKSATIVNLLFFHLGFSSEALAFRKMLICVAVTGTTILHRSTQCDITLSRSTMCIAQPKSCLNLGDFLQITRLSICRPNELITHSCCRFFQRRPAGGPRGDFTPQALFLKEMRGRKKKRKIVPCCLCWLCQQQAWQKIPKWGRETEVKGGYSINEGREREGFGVGCCAD